MESLSIYLYDDRSTVLMEIARISAKFLCDASICPLNVHI